jgi:hypothetical protein
MHCGAEVTESSTNKQHHISSPKFRSWRQECGSSLGSRPYPHDMHEDLSCPTDLDPLLRHLISQHARSAALDNSCLGPWCSLMRSLRGGQSATALLVITRYNHMIARRALPPHRPRQQVGARAIDRGISNADVRGRGAAAEVIDPPVGLDAEIQLRRCTQITQHQPPRGRWTGNSLIA